jgi:tetratricopeptide (TPR) repeat protein
MAIYKALFLVLSLVFFSSYLLAQSSVWSQHMDAGIAASSTKDYDTAIIEFSVVLPIAEKYLSDSPKLGANHRYLADAYRDKGDYDNAEKHYRLAISSTEKAIGADDIQLSFLLNHIGNNYLEMGNLHQGVALNERSLEISEKVLGPKHPETGIGRYSMGNAYSKVGRHADAILQYERSIPAVESKHGRVYPLVADIYHSIGQSQVQLKNYQQAEIALKECLQLRTEIYGARHDDVGWTHNNLGWAYVLDGKYEYADRHLSLAIETWKSTEGSDPKNMASVLNNLCVLRDKQGRAEEAVKLCRKALSIATDGYGPDHSKVEYTQINLDIALEHLNR